MTENYEKEFLKTVDTLCEVVARKWPHAAEGAIAWAVANAPELDKEEEKLFARINTQWINALDFTDYKKTLLEWGRTMLRIYKAYAEEKKEDNGGCPLDKQEHENEKCD